MVVVVWSERFFKIRSFQKGGSRGKFVHNCGRNGFEACMLRIHTLGWCRGPEGHRR